MISSSKTLMRMRRVLLLLLGVAGCVVTGTSGKALETPDRTSALFRQADFIGFVEGDVTSRAEKGEWRQAVYSFSVETLKGALPRTPGRNPMYPYIWGGHMQERQSASQSSAQYHAAAWPTWFGEKGVYLVFLQRTKREGRDAWNALATFPIDYRPDASGRVVGTLGHGTGRTKTTEAVRALIGQSLSGGTLAQDAMAILAALLQPMQVAANTPPRPVSYAQRLKEVQPLIAAIRPGLQRTEVEKIFRKQDGGLMSMTQIRYYLGSEVMVEVPYDSKERVNGPIKVARSGMHFD